MLIRCSQCDSEFHRKPSEVNESGVNCCSRACFLEYKKAVTKLLDCECGICGKHIKRYQSDIDSTKTGKVYCSRSCTAVASNSESVRGVIETIHNYRSRALSEYGHTCNKCGYDEEPKILQVHHKDADRSNNALTNLEVLCPNCHAIEHWT